MSDDDLNKLIPMRYCTTEKSGTTTTTMVALPNNALELEYFNINFF
ncbi:MAG: hypothetical protein M3247_02225 [Thermoproteota archaeon]|nr:hypothetical protein [Thermoproteota archaeon]